jgi:hypothetical protein
LLFVLLGLHGWLCFEMTLRLNGKLADVYIDNEDNQNDLKILMLLPLSYFVTEDHLKSSGDKNISL